MAWLDELLMSLGGGQPGQGTVLAPQGQPQAPPPPPPQPQQQGGFGQTMGNIGSVLQNIGGSFVDVLGVISALDRGNLGAYQEQHRRALDDPAFQKTITPFQAGMYGQHLHADPQGQLVPNLPPLSAQAQAEQGKSQYEAQLYQRAQQGDPSAMVALGMPLSTEQAKEMAAQSGVGTPGGPSRVTMKVPGGTATYGGQAGSAGPNINFPIGHYGGKIGSVGPDGHFYQMTPDAPPEDPTVKAFIDQFMGTGFVGGSPETPPPQPSGGAPTQAPITPTQPAPPQVPGEGIVKSKESVTAWEARHPQMGEAEAATPPPEAAPAAGIRHGRAFPTQPASELLQQPEPGGRVGRPSPAFIDTRPSAAPAAPQAAPPTPAPTAPPAPTQAPGARPQPQPRMAPPGWSLTIDSKGQRKMTFNADRYNKAISDQQKVDQPKGQVKDQLNRLEGALNGFKALFGDPRDPKSGNVTDSTGKNWGKVRDLLPSGKSFLGGAAESYTTTQYKLWQARRQGDPRAQAFEAAQPQAIDFARASGGGARMAQQEINLLAKAFVPSGYESQEEFDNKLLLTYRFFESVRDGLKNNVGPDTLKTMRDTYYKAQTGRDLDADVSAAETAPAAGRSPTMMAPIDVR